MEDPTPSRRAVLRWSGLGIAGITGCMATDESAHKVESTTETTTTPQTTTDFLPHTTEQTTTEQTTTEGQTTEEATNEEQTTQSPPADLCRSVDPTIVQNDPLLVKFNSRQQRRCAGHPIDAFEDLSPWEALEGSVSSDTDTYFSGSQSARIESSSAGRVVLTRHFDEPLDLSDRDLSIAVKLEQPRTGWLRLHLLAPDRANSMVLSRYFGSDTWLRHDLGPKSIEGVPDLTNVQAFQIEVEPTGGSLRACLDSIRTVPRPKRGSVMLTFDDNVISQYETAFPIMQKYGMAGVVGVIDSAVGSDAHIPLEGMHEMQAAGWEMVSHPHTSRSKKLLELSEEGRRAEIRANKQWLIDNGFERGSRFIIWPFNAYDSSALTLASRHHYMGFSLSDTPVGHRLTDPLITGRIQGDDPDLVKQSIDFAAQYNQLAVLMYHSIGSADWISESDFEDIISYINRADIDVITTSDLWRTLQS